MGSLGCGLLILTLHFGPKFCGSFVSKSVSEWVWTSNIKVLCSSNAAFVWSFFLITSYIAPKFHDSYRPLVYHIIQLLIGIELSKVCTRRPIGRGDLLEPPFWPPKNFIHRLAMYSTVCPLALLPLRITVVQTGVFAAMHSICPWKTSGWMQNTCVSALRHCVEGTCINTSVNKLLLQASRFHHAVVLLMKWQLNSLESYHLSENA